MKTIDKGLENYTRHQYTVAEKIYKNYQNMRMEINGLESIKYEINDPYITSEDFKQGFIAGVKVMNSIFMDL